MNTPTRSGLSCTIKCLIEATAKAVALRHGCTEEQANTLHCSPSRRITPTFATLRAGDGRIVRTFDSISDLDEFMANEIEGRFFGRAVRRACAG